MRSGNWLQDEIGFSFRRQRHHASPLEFVTKISCYLPASIRVGLGHTEMAAKVQSAPESLLTPKRPEAG